MNKILSIVLITLLLVVSLALVSCGDDTIVECTEHDFVETVVASTCSRNGYTEHVCSICGYSYKDNYTDTHDRVVTVIEPTCTEEGYTKVTCKKCNWEIREDIKSINLDNHKWNEGDKIPHTCTAFGYTLQTCEYCNVQREINYVAPNHDWTEWGLVEADGVVCGDLAIESRVCKLCSEVDERIAETFVHKCENITLILASGELIADCDCGQYRVEHSYEYKDVLVYELVGEGDEQHYVVKGFKAGTSTDDKKEVYIPHSIGELNENGEVVNAIPVTEIANAAFMNEDEIESLVLSTSVTKIDVSAFSYCSGLKTITFDGTLEDWTNVNKVYTWNHQAGLYTVYCTDGTVNE